MIRLHPEQLNQKLSFIDEYIQAKNAADGSKLDANANVTQKKYCHHGARVDERFLCANQPRQSQWQNP